MGPSAILENVRALCLQGIMGVLPVSHVFQSSGFFDQRILRKQGCSSYNDTEWYLTKHLLLGDMPK